MYADVLWLRIYRENESQLNFIWIILGSKQTVFRTHKQENNIKKLYEINKKYWENMILWGYQKVRIIF